MRPSVLSLLATMLVCLWSLSATAATTERVSVASDGTEGNWESEGAPSLSADGRFVSFSSIASNLVPNDRNGTGWDAFVHDRLTGETHLVSLADDGSQIDPQPTYNYSPVSLSGDGRYVAFEANASNLVADDTNGEEDVFVHDRETGETVRVSVASDGSQGDGWSAGPSISSDGRFIAFSSSATNLSSDYTGTGVETNVFVHDLLTGETELVSIAKYGTLGYGSGYDPCISSEGRFVAFVSSNNGLVPDDVNRAGDIFVCNRESGQMELVSVNSDGEQSERSRWSFDPSISADGRFVAFRSYASNLVAGDTNEEGDVFVHDRETGETVRVSVASDGGQGDDQSGFPCISGDGRFVVFESMASDLVPDDTNGVIDVFVHDRETGVTERVNVAADGAQAHGGSFDVFTEVSISADGRLVAFASSADNLVPDDTNRRADIFVRDRQTFEDVPVGYWAFYEIEGCVRSSVVVGCDGDLYRPEYAVTRAQMAVYIARALAGGEENIPEGPQSSSFLDVRRDHWAFDHVEYCVDNGVIGGYGLSLYHPEREVTRDQMAVYVARSLVAPMGEAGLADYVPADPRNFPDVPSDHWAYTHIEYCVENGVVSGYLDGNYHPEGIVTRDQMAVYVARAFGLL